MHLPLLRQGWEAQSSVLIWQNTPSYPTYVEFSKKKKHGKKRQNGRQISYETETSHTHTPSTRTVLTWHTNAVKTTDLIKAGGVVLARIRLALVHVHFTAWPLIALEALALE